MSALQPYQTELIEHAMAIGALKFGSFTLKSGRVSPYFFNAGLMSSGSILHTVARAYASDITRLQSSDAIPQFDVIFGPAYKGIALAACTALVLSAEHGRDIGFAYDRKEAKAHGEGGVMVGVPVQGKRVLVLDDVMTAGTAIRQAMATIAREGGEVVGVVQCLDREEVGQDGKTSTAVEIGHNLGGQGRVASILKMRDLIAWLETKGMLDELTRMKGYRDTYGYKG